MPEAQLVSMDMSVDMSGYLKTYTYHLTYVSTEPMNMSEFHKQMYHPPEVHDKPVKIKKVESAIRQLEV